MELVFNFTTGAYLLSWPEPSLVARANCSRTLYLSSFLCYFICLLCLIGSYLMISIILMRPIYNESGLCVAVKWPSFYITHFNLRGNKKEEGLGLPTVNALSEQLINKKLKKPKWPGTAKRHRATSFLFIQGCPGSFLYSQDSLRVPKHQVTLRCCCSQCPTLHRLTLSQA